jgi:hypothetical membrane protein
MKSQTQLNIAGTLLFLAGGAIIVGIITGETFYPTDYNTLKREISDLGGTRPPNSIIYEPSATIFNNTTLVIEMMIFIASLFIHQLFKKWLFTIPLTIFGLGVFDVVIFPGHVVFWHGIFDLVTFIFGSITAIAAFKIVPTPFRYIGICIGTTSLIFLYGANIFSPCIGTGGTERWVAYTVVFWLIGFGGFLLGTKEETKNTKI